MTIHPLRLRRKQRRSRLLPSLSGHTDVSRHVGGLPSGDGAVRGVSRAANSAETFGDTLSRKRPPNCFRFMLLNHGGFPVFMKEPKHSQLKQYLLKCNMDVIGLTENNLHWKNISVHERLHTRLFGWWETLQISSAYYDTYPTVTRSQVGGTCVLSTGKAAHRVFQYGRDPRGLGRWSWTRYQGKGGITFRIAVGYRPVPNQTGPLSAWSQQKAFFQNIDIDDDPRTMFLSDLEDSVREWKSAGDQVLLACDFNDDIRSGPVDACMRRLGLKEAILHRHGRYKAPKTYIDGSYPIDALFVTPALLDFPCGYLDWEFDHRGLWIELPMPVVLGQIMPPIIRPQARRLNTRDPRVVVAYTTELLFQLDKHNFDERVRALDLAVGTTISPAQQLEYNTLDQIKCTATLYAEKRCRKFRKGAISWTPKYKKLRLRRIYWQLSVRKAYGQRISTKKLSRMAKTLRIKWNPNRTLDEIHAKLKAAKKAYNRFTPKADEARATFIEGLAQARAQLNDTTQADELRKMRRIEEQRRSARVIKFVNQKLTRGGISSVLAPMEDGTWVEMTTKEDIEQACLDEDERRFNQARDTPFLQEPLFSAVGPLGVGPGADAILNGTFEIPPGTDPYAAKLIPFLAKPASVTEPISTDLSLEEHQQSWLRSREQTSSGPSKMHFGHAKANARNPRLAEYDRIMRAIPYRTGFSPDRWRHGTNVMIEKKKGDFHVTRLRALLLYELEFNQNNKKTGRDMMYNAEDLNLIAIEQYGSRKGLDASGHSINKVLSNDLIRLLRRPAALCSNDAKSCYDRIVHAIASLCMQRVGLPKEPIICMFTTIQNLNHYIRTVFGDSEISFSGALWVIPIQGVGQGNGGGPQIWAVVSTPVLNLMRSMGFGACFKAAITGETVSFVGFSFVDDTDLFQTARDPSDTYATVAAAMNDFLDNWEGALRATGGALVPAKSHWYLVDFVWSGATWRYARIDETPAELHVRDQFGQVQKLERLEVSEARRTLGVRIAMDGNNNAEFMYLKGVATNWVENTRNGHLPSHYAWQSMLTTVLKTLQFPMVATTLSRPQCDKIMSIVLQGGLPASGIARSFPYDMVYASLDTFGLAVPDLFVVQGIQKIQRILRTTTGPQMIEGRLIRVAIQQHLVELGCAGPLFHLPFSPWGNLATKSWIRHVWHFMSLYGISITDDLPQIPLWREFDNYIMVAFVHFGYSIDQLLRLKWMSNVSPCCFPL